MTRIEALKSLEKHNSDGCQADYHDAFGENWQIAQDACCGSLDAAKALHDAVLPGWNVAFITQTDTQWRVRLQERGGNSSSTKAKNPASAWLVSILAALISECENE